MDFADSFLRAYMASRPSEAEQRQSALHKLFEPYLKQAQADQRGSIQANPDYGFGASDDVIQANRLGMSRADYGKMRGALASLGVGSPVQEEPSPIKYNPGLDQQDWMNRHGWLLTMTGLKADALPWAARTGEENRLAALVRGGLAESADEKRRNDIYAGRVSADNQQGALGRLAQSLGVLGDEGTAGNNLREVAAAVAQDSGITTPFVVGDIPIGRKDAAEQPQAGRDNSAAWYDRTWRRIKAENPNMSDQQVTDYMTYLINATRE